MILLHTEPADCVLLGPLQLNHLLLYYHSKMKVEVAVARLGRQGPIQRQSQ